MKQCDKYKKQYFMPPQLDLDFLRKDAVDSPPIWCSVDLRDGNQALVVPMSLDEKISFFKHLVEIGFKEIEVGFPAASETEYTFLRRLIEDHLIPDDVTIQVLTQAREHIIERTFAALVGAKKAVVHLYNSTSYAQREQVFCRTKDQIRDMAVQGAHWVLAYANTTEGNFSFEYSPESFTGTEIDFALEVCNSVIDIWQPTAQNKVIINLPATVSHSMPHVYGAQIHYMCKYLHQRENLVVSLHPHNDRGCAVADAEMGLLAGADRVEGTLFGNGERTGNVDLVTLALNLYSYGVDPKLQLDNMPRIVEAYETYTNMQVYARQPYSGSLVFAAFSGSHQDAIAKGIKFREEQNCAHWTVPYLPIDPKDIGRQYDGDVIRINSQSGKGGIGYLLEQQMGLMLPAKMREDFGYCVKQFSDTEHRELSPGEICDIFQAQYLNQTTVVAVIENHFIQQKTGIEATVTLAYQGEQRIATAQGNGRLDAVSEALQKALEISFVLQSYQEHAIGQGTNAKAVAYISVLFSDKLVWGCGMHEDTIEASIFALLSCLNRSNCL